MDFWHGNASRKLSQGGSLKKMTLALSGQNNEMHEIQNALGDEMVLIDSVKSEVE